MGLCSEGVPRTMEVFHRLQKERHTLLHTLHHSWFAAVAAGSLVVAVEHKNWQKARKDLLQVQRLLVVHKCWKLVV
jgi:hypothetical protein